MASIVFSLLWLCWVGSLLGLLLGYDAKKEIENFNGAQSGGGLATAGILFGWLGMASLAGLGAMVYLAKNQ